MILAECLQLLEPLAQFRICFGQGTELRLGCGKTFFNLLTFGKIPAQCVLTLCDGNLQDRKQPKQHRHYKSAGMRMLWEISHKNRALTVLQMQEQNAASFFDAFGILVGAMSGRDDLLGNSALEMGTPVGHHSIG
jgi:hypothetical protein